MSELIGGWVAGLTATLIREGINKHRAREIAQGYWEAYCKDDLEAEIAQLRRDHETEVQRLTQERAALRAEVERLRAALQKIAYLQHDIGRPPLISEAEAMRIKARDALHDSRAIERAHGIGGGE